MYFSHKKLLFAVGLLALAPTLAFAQKADYLFVSAEFSGGAFSYVSVEEYATSPANVDLYESGTYEMRLMGDGAMLGNNFFEMPDNQEMEAIGRSGGNRIYSTATLTKQRARVALPLTASIDPQNSRLQILKRDAVLFDKKLSELDIDIVSANTNRILTQDSSVPPLPPPFSEPSLEQKTSGGLRWIILILALGAVVFILHKTGKLQLILQKFRRGVDKV